MLQAFGLSYEPSPLAGPLFTDLRISLAKGEKVALLGRNGAGKTKLLEILLGLTRPSSGRVELAKGCRMAYLPQDLPGGFEGTLAEFLGIRDGEDPAFEARIWRMAARMNIGEAMMERPYPLLSLGERMRAALALLLLDDPDLLLLDEPTNHLDLEARLWLEGFLGCCRQGVLFVCHDRAMVNAVAHRSLELENGALIEYAGGYDALLSAKEQNRARQMQEWERGREEQRRLKIVSERMLQKAAEMTRKPTQRTYDPKQKAFFAGKEKKLDKRAAAIRSRIDHANRERVEKPIVLDAVCIQFSARALRSSQPLTVRGLSKSFGERPLFERLDLTIEAGARVALVGPNGCGKTTLLRILLGEESADSGQVEWSSDAMLAFLSQSRTQLELDKPILEALALETPAREQMARTLLGRLLIRGEAVRKNVGVLSVGERTKVELVRILLSPANVLLLDEPTNHLDIESLEAIEEALIAFPGSVVFTSHDRAFVERVATERVGLEVWRSEGLEV